MQPLPTHPEPQHPSHRCCEPTGPHSNGLAALGVTWVPHMAALGWGLGCHQFCILSAGGGPLGPGGWGHGAKKRGLGHLLLLVFRDLSNNQISEIAPDAFQGLRSLNSL